MMKLKFFSKLLDKRIAAYQRELIETHYKEVDNMYRQMRGWRHDYRGHIQTMKVLAAQGDMDGIKAYLDAPNHENPNLFSIGEGLGFFVFFGNENNGSSLTAVCPKPYQKKDRITKVTTVRVP